MGGPIPSRVPGNRSWTACAITCAVEWRSTASPSGESAGTASTSVSCSGAQARSRSAPEPISRTPTAPPAPSSETPAACTASRALRRLAPAAALTAWAETERGALVDTEPSSDDYGADQSHASAAPSGTRAHIPGRLGLVDANHGRGCRGDVPAHLHRSEHLDVG